VFEPPDPGTRARAAPEAAREAAAPGHETAPQLLACKSFMMGTCNLLVIGLPAGSRVQSGPFPPEVDRWRLRGEVNWATSGRTSFRAFVPSAGGSPARREWLRVDGRVEIEPQGTRASAALADPARVLSSVVRQGEVTLGGHPGRWASGTVRRGSLLRPEAAPALAVSVLCPGTRRRIRIIMEADAESTLEALLPHLEACLACH